MTDTAQANADKNSKSSKQVDNRPTPIARLPIAQVDTALIDCEKTIKSHSDIVKVKLTNNTAIPTDVLRELSRANAQKAKLTMRRISILIEIGDTSALELIEKLMKIKPAKSAG